MVGAEPPLYGALDLGTNNCRLLLARPSADGFRVVDSYSRIVRLGEGLAATGRLSPAAMERTLAALRVCAQRLARRGVAAARTVATEACRRAANGEEFLARVTGETGLVLEVISTAEEARLALAGCAGLLDPARPYALVFDIGGGSTEVSWAATGAATGAAGGGGTVGVIDMVSLPIGVVTLSERYGGAAGSAAGFAAMVAEADAGLAAFDRRHAIARRVAEGAVQMLGTSGTVTTLAGVEMGLPRYDRSRVDGYTLDFATIDDIVDYLLSLSPSGLAAVPCIGRQRADLVLAGCAVLMAIRRRWPVGRLRVADRGLREGILLGLMDG
ncbi:MAG: Ppx/GppA phosphatase family protein [Thalassobaculales bacterium]